jgi:hypothetical protein
MRGAPDMPGNMELTTQREEAEKLSAGKRKAEDSEPSTSELQQQISELRSQFSTLRQSSINENQGTREDGLALSVKERQKYEEIIRELKKSREEREAYINNLLQTNESILREKEKLEERYRASIALREKEKKTRDETELALNSQNAATKGLYRKEKERAQKLMKTMAEMQNADPFKLDNTHISSNVKELRYAIKNWARAQRLVPSVPAQGSITQIAGRLLGLADRGPYYEFFKDITSNFQEYTESPQDFKRLLQAYVWKYIVKMVFEDDLWAGTRKPLDESSPKDTGYMLQKGYWLMKSKLEQGQ